MSLAIQITLKPFRKGLTILMLGHLVPLELVFNITQLSVLAMIWLAQTITVILNFTALKKEEKFWSDDSN